MEPLTWIAIVVAAAALGGWAVTAVSHNRLRRGVVRALDRIGVRHGDHPGEHDLERAIAAVAHDIAEVERASLRYSGAVHHADIGIFVVDDDGSVVFANPVAERYVGARHGDAVAEARLRELLDDVRRRREALEAELEVYTPSRRQLRLRAVPLGDGAGAALYVVDISEHHRVQSVRRDFVANVSHELKTPLGALSVLAEALVDADDADTRRRLAERLGSEAKRMAELVDDILDLSHIEADGEAKSRLGVCDAVEEAAAAVVVLAEQHRIAVDVECEDPGLAVIGDRRQLVSAIANLLDNAIKYTAVDEEQTGIVWCRARREGDEAVIEVEDHGIGIPEAQQARIFERFYRVDPARSRMTGGTGLGLSIVKNVAKRHGGRVEVESQFGKGSVFRLRIPAAP